MSLFFLTFFIIYACMHALVFLKGRLLLPDRWPAQLSLALFLLLMFLGPMVVRFLERHDHEDLARLTGSIAYNWLGLVFLTFVGLVALELLAAAGKLVQVISGANLPPIAGARGTAVVFCIALAAAVYGNFEAWSIRVERVRIETGKLPPGVEHIRIAQISDVHLGLLVREARLQRILDKVRQEAPDMLVSTGDLIDGNSPDIEPLAQLFDGITAPMGKFAVTGNHEVYAGLDRSLAFTRRLGFQVLRGEAVCAGGAITVAGVDDPATGAAVTSEQVLQDVREGGRFTLLLKHRPEANPASLGLFDLQLSGHTHLGQIFPFRYVTGRVYPMQNGFYRLSNGSALYTSRGSGTWGPPMRLLAPPEVTIIDLWARKG